VADVDDRSIDVVFEERLQGTLDLFGIVDSKVLANGVAGTRRMGCNVAFKRIGDGDFRLVVARIPQML
jgi:hypothetical protein